MMWSSNGIIFTISFLKRSWLSTVLLLLSVNCHDFLGKIFEFFSFAAEFSLRYCLKHCWWGKKMASYFVCMGHYCKSERRKLDRNLNSNRHFHFLCRYQLTLSPHGIYKDDTVLIIVTEYIIRDENRSKNKKNLYSFPRHVDSLWTCGSWFLQWCAIQFTLFEMCSMSNRRFSKYTFVINGDSDKNVNFLRCWYLLNLAKSGIELR